MQFSPRNSRPAAFAFCQKDNVLFAQAAGREFLGENCIHTGDYATGLEHAQRELVIAERLHSRERRAWIHYYSAQCRLFLGESEQAEREFLDGIALAEAIGENRVLSLMRPTLAVALAIQGRLDEALKIASENLQQSSPTLLYSHFEALRCLV